MSKVTFHTSRTAARTAAKSTAGVSFKDFGPEAPKGERWATVAMAAKAPKLKDGVKPAKRVRTTGKKPAAVALITKLMAKDVSRKEIIAELVDKVGLTSAGASTYFANVKRNAPGWTL